MPTTSLVCAPWRSQLHQRALNTYHPKHGSLRELLTSIAPQHHRLRSSKRRKEPLAQWWSRSGSPVSGARTSPSTTSSSPMPGKELLSGPSFSRRCESPLPTYLQLTANSTSPPQQHRSQQPTSRGPRHLRPHPQARPVRPLGPPAQGHQARYYEGEILDRCWSTAHRHRMEAIIICMGVPRVQFVPLHV